MLSGSQEGRTELERYEVLGELGQGGMSVVFRARDKQLGRDVALKVLHDFLARQPDARKRFHREAVAVARLRHPGIVEIYDYSGPDAEDAYIVCEIIEGHTLRQFVDTHGAPAHPEFGAMVIQELVRALRHAHEQGIVHRDVKPENVMLTERGQLKLMDFGIAQIMEGATKLTATGTLLGSPAHMAPEVIDGKASDHRSDIFSVGTMLFWLCTGQMPFSAPNPSALFRLILEGTFEPPQMLNPKIGNGLARIIERTLQPDPEVRYQDVSELQEDLQKELDEVGLVPSESVVKAYLVDPATFTAEWGPKLTATLVQRGQAALAEGNTGRAMDRFNRVLAIDAQHPEVARLVSQIGRRRAVHRRARHAAMSAAAVILLGGGAYGATRLWPLVAPAEVPAPPPEVRTAAVLAPTTTPKPAVAPEPAMAPEPGPTPSRAIGIQPAPDKPRARVGRAMTVRPPTGPTLEPARLAARAPIPTLSPVVPAPAVSDKTKLFVKIGPGWGHIRINGQLKRRYAMGESFELSPGRYTVEVVRPDGQHTPRILEVEADRVYEIGANGQRRRLVENELSFRMPGRGEIVKGWIPKSEEARAPTADRGT